MKSLILLTFLASSLSFAETKTIPVKDMTCGGCVANVKKAVCEGLKYSKENCSVKIGELKVTGDNIDMKAIETALVDAGYGIADANQTATAAEAITKTEAAPTKKK